MTWIFVILLISSTTTFAAEFCYDKYNVAITNANAELGALLKRQSEIDTRLGQIFVSIADKAGELVKASQEIPPDPVKIKKIGDEIAALGKEKTQLEAEGYQITDRVAALKGTVPAELAGELRGCVETSKPADSLVNLTIQALAILSTGGASLALPPKALYVDMSAVLNGYPTGGPNSAVNKGRQVVLDAIGAGGENNDLGKVINNPGHAVTTCFGLCGHL